MEARTLGSLRVSTVGVGCNNFGGRLDQERASAVVLSALEAGVNFFDTADTYGATQSEVFLGRALGTRRDEAIIATKFGMPIDDDHFGAAPTYVKSACEASLRRLGTDRIDLYQLHYPDHTVPIADTLGALNELINEGKVREVGCSNFNVEQLREARAAVGDARGFASIQNQYSLLDRGPERDGVLNEVSTEGMGFLPFYPLANGLLTGKYRPGEPIPEGTRLALMPQERSVHWLSDAFQHRVSILLAYAQRIEVPILTLAFSWLLSHPSVTSVIAGASTPEQVRANANAARVLSEVEIDELDRLSA